MLCACRMGNENELKTLGRMGAPTSDDARAEAEIIVDKLMLHKIDFQ